MQELDNTNRNFKGQQKNEIVYSFSRRHWVVLFPYFMMLAVFLVLLTVFFIYAKNIRIALSPGLYSFVALIGVAIFTLTLHRFFLRFLNYYLQIFIITNFRIVQLNQTLYFNRERNSIDLSDIQDVIIEQNGVVKTLLNYGEITVTVSSGQFSKVIRYVPNPEYYFRKINKTKREYISLRRAEKAAVVEDRGAFTT